MSSAITWITSHWPSIVPWLGWALVEARSLNPAWKTSGVIEFILKAIGYTGEQPTIPKT